MKTEEEPLCHTLHLDFNIGTLYTFVSTLLLLGSTEPHQTQAVKKYLPSWVAVAFNPSP